ncbi:major tail protein [Caldibacillus thermoamylovorans]|uniref:major tail protein n=1 Tax=Caldibacillus thermoamylovorans TaxID=35841 RepID=UPI0022E483E7|nr:major tail protein [Caldibacillus thermoamylovorans]
MAGVVVGLKDLHYAKLTNDDTTGVVYETPKKIAGAITATISPTTNSATLYADDGAAETASSLGEISVTLNTKDLPKAIQADLLGHKVNSDGVLVRSADDVAPYVAIGFRSMKSNGQYRYIWLYKGKFQPHEQSYQTKGDTPTFQTPTINGVFVKREIDNRWQAEVDADDENVNATVITNWFTSVYEETTDTGA